MARGTGTLVEKVVAELDVVDIHVTTDVIFKDKIVMIMAEYSRMVSCSCFCVILCAPVKSSLQGDTISVYERICKIYLN
jgi:hypothetical protein